MSQCSFSDPKIFPKLLVTFEATPMATVSWLGAGVRLQVAIGRALGIVTEG